MRKFLVTVAASLLLAAGFAPRAEASVGIGFLYSSTPVGLFFRLNDQTAFHVGVGIDIRDTEENSGALKSIFSVAGTVLFDVWTGDCWGFGLAPGVIFSTTSFEDIDEVERDSATEIAVLLWLMGHYDPCDWLSFWFGHGLTISIDDDGINDSTTNFHTDAGNLGEVGFTVWLPE